MSTEEGTSADPIGLFTKWIKDNPTVIKEAISGLVEGLARSGNISEALDDCDVQFTIITKEDKPSVMLSINKKAGAKTDTKRLIEHLGKELAKSQSKTTAMESAVAQSMATIRDMLVAAKKDTT